MLNQNEQSRYESMKKILKCYSYFDDSELNEHHKQQIKRFQADVKEYEARIETVHA